MGELRLRGETMENVIENKAPVGAEQQKPAKKKKPVKTIAAAVLDHIIVILFAAFIVVPLTILLPKIGNLGVDGVFWAEPISNLIGGCACFITMLCTVLPELKRIQKNK